jgi:hypothetical protein
MHWTVRTEKDLTFLRVGLRDHYTEEDISGSELIYSLVSPAKTETNHLAFIHSKLAMASKQASKLSRTCDLLLPRRQPENLNIN